MPIPLATVIPAKAGIQRGAAGKEVTLPPILDLHLGDILTLKKQHPCGGSTWEVVRVGMDIGIVCRTCNRRVMLQRSELERRVKRHEPAQ